MIRQRKENKGKECEMIGRERDDNEVKETMGDDTEELRDDKM